MFYEECNSEWYQGDIVHLIPIIATDLTETNPSKSLKLFDKRAIVVSQTCDLQRRPFTHLCPIHDFEFLKKELISNGKSENGAEKFLDSVRNRNVNYYFYLPADEALDLKEGYADLNFISTVSRTQLIKLSRLATLADHPRQILAYQIGNLFLRPH